jgi:hypothetical protein
LTPEPAHGSPVPIFLAQVSEQRLCCCGLVCRRSPGSILTGVTTRFQVIDTDEQAHVAGVAFRPGGTVPFVTTSAYELRDTEVPLEALWAGAHAASAGATSHDDAP